jgi:hypothetical protein
VSTYIPEIRMTLARWRRLPKNGARKGWSQQQAADWYGVSKRQWQRWEAGTTPAPRPLINRLADDLAGN